MKFSKLRLSGFKSFVEPTELHIQHGLTGVVGPNGCGKSNLLEALRWVMGENSYKSMRGSGMEDVIFAGSGERPARNLAEVMLTLENEERTAPPGYNDTDRIEISRVIERDEGSTYRVNTKEVRARDVQLFFADASTGSRSPALVKQGQIGDLINAKPQARRLILEEAAGISGLHTRRHEAELKLKAAEQNLSRIDDITAQLDAQLASLKRQARQAIKYKSVSSEIRKLEAAGLFVAWRDATATVDADVSAVDQSTRALAEHTRLASEALRARDEAGDLLPNLREQEAIRGAVLQRMALERAALDEEGKRVEARLGELKSRKGQVAQDISREEGLVGDTGDVLARLASEAETLEAASGSDAELRGAAAAALQAAAEQLARVQEEADAAAAKLSELAAQRSAIERVVSEQRTRISRLDQEQTNLAARRQNLLAQIGDAGEGATLTGAVEAAIAAAALAETEANDAEAAVRAARASEAEKRQAFEDVRRATERLQTEVRTLTNFLKPAAGALWPPLVDALQVEQGFELALAAALGDDIESSSDEGAPSHWRGLPALPETATLPAGVEPLSLHVKGPQSLARVLSQIGVVSREVGAALQSQLLPGQKLVTREGDQWRWDGFVAAADAPSAAAKRLAEKNRLATLERGLGSAQADTDHNRVAYEEAKAAVENGVRAEREKRENWRASTAALEVARRALQSFERKTAEHAQQTSALDEALRRTAESQREVNEALARADGELVALPALDGLQAVSAECRNQLNQERATYGEARARHDGLEREARMRADRLTAIAAEQTQWSSRAEKAKAQIEHLAARLAETEAAIAELVSMPQQLADKRQKLMNLLSESERDKKAASDALQEAENALRAADQHLRAMQEQAGDSREEHARFGARLEASRQRQEHCLARISETLQVPPERILEEAGIEVTELPPSDEIERKLIKLREDRERLGAVNLRADEEAQAVETQLDKMRHEKDELVQAIAKLRGAISSLNREGRQRLLDAFAQVNTKFSELFTTLFNGGTAELQLIESDDPLEAGLEILAKPPGKNPSTLSLLSGGEQTLTAMALIFAVFLTNPSPICVLDEVDAPLDDHNVGRFCNLLDAMLQKTETRFLIITHHPLTMARMHRLFGVTMMERGVSQLVSVDLEAAELLAKTA